MGQIAILKRPSNTEADWIAEQVAREIGCGKIIGENLTKWRQARGISYDEIWEKLGISALKYRSWETGSASPACSEFFSVTRKLGSEAYFEAGILVNDLLYEGQLLRKLIARGERWDLGHKPGEAALGAVRRFAA